jgi:hypothetical protein
MTKTTTVTLAAARKNLARAYAKAEEHVGIYGKAWLGGKVYQLEGGIRTLKERAVTNARRLVEAMVARELTRVEKRVIKGNDWTDPGFSTVYLVGSEVLLVIHSSQDKIGLGADRQMELDRFLASRTETGIENKG